jgi:hypothetical protein
LFNGILKKTIFFRNPSIVKNLKSSADGASVGAAQVPEKLTSSPKIPTDAKPIKKPDEENVSVVVNIRKRKWNFNP